MKIDPDNCRDPDLLAAEVRRLRALIASGEPTLTAAERSAVADAADRYAEITPESRETAATLRVLLERTK